MTKRGGIKATLLWCSVRTPTLQEAGTAPCLQVLCESFSRATKSENLWHSAGCKQPFPAQPVNPLVQAEHQGTTSAGFHSFFSPNPQPKTLDQRPSQPCLSSQPLTLLAPTCPRTGLVSFLSQFSFTVCMFFSISCKSLLLSGAYQRCLFHCLSTFPVSLTQIFVPPGKWHFLHLS